jgi:hypothetical protein
MLVDTNTGIFILVNGLDFNELIFIEEVYNELRVNFNRFKKEYNFKDFEIKNYEKGLLEIKKNCDFQDKNQKADRELIKFIHEKTTKIMTHDVKVIRECLLKIPFEKIKFLLDYLIEKNYSIELINKAFEKYVDKKFKKDILELNKEDSILSFYVGKTIKNYNNYCRRIFVF